METLKKIGKVIWSPFKFTGGIIRHPYKSLIKASRVVRGLGVVLGVLYGLDFQIGMLDGKPVGVKFDLSGLARFGTISAIALWVGLILMGFGMPGWGYLAMGGTLLLGQALIHLEQGVLAWDIMIRKDLYNVIAERDIVKTQAKMAEAVVAASQETVSASRRTIKANALSPLAITEAKKGVRWSQESEDGVVPQITEARTTLLLPGDLEEVFEI